ncbi:hypothetical protein FBEOM_7088 [Fusarium beomiforme]|uniref:Uncharacterized protein n=1 Tax=Fusarium beomiforme TaxID=44412 RepID=A0A9P5AI43_9HYPO|nr:hypothetical protein FBEOM_7088 [Fusarium beomiforme]
MFVLPASLHPPNPYGGSYIEECRQNLAAGRHYGSIDDNIRDKELYRTPWNCLPDDIQDLIRKELEFMFFEETALDLRSTNHYKVG